MWARVRPPLATVVALVALLALTGCGGGSSSPSAPTPTPTPAPAPVPTPPPPPPATFVCGAIGGFLSSPQSIINGLVCSGETSPVVMVLLEDALGKAVGFCSGSVIAPNAVLTSAHCLVDNTKRVAILLGGLSGRAIAATSFTPIPAYSGANQGSPDVGVVIVGEDLGRTPLPMLVSRDVVPGEQGVIAGYGLDASGGQGVLHAGTVTIFRIGDTAFSSYFGSDVSNTCSGDSGGPLLVLQDGTWGIAGVTEAGASADCLSGLSNFARLRNDTLSSFVFALVPTARRL